MERIPTLLFILSVLLFAANPFSLLDFPLDDAWIHRVYSQSFAFGHGFAYNPGQQEAGSTSPLWSIVTAPAHWLEPLGTDAVVLAVKFVGVALALVAISMAKKIGRHLGSSGKTGVLAGILLALDPRLAFSALSGMETCLLLALWLGAVHSLHKNRMWLAACLASLSTTARPESLVILPFFVLAVLVAFFDKKIKLRRLWPLLILPIPMMVWSLYCHHANGHWLPTTFYMKSTTIAVDAEQFSHSWTLLGLNGPLPSILVAVLLMLTAGFLLYRLKSPESFLLLIAAPLTFLFGVLFSRMFLLVGYYWLRWTDPATILLTSTAGIGVAIVLTCSRNWKPKAAVSLALLMAIPHFFGSFTTCKSRLATDCRSINLITVQAAKWINQNTPEDAVIGVNDAGATRYFSQRRTIDLMGLNCADIAFKTMRPENNGIIDYLAITPAWFYGQVLYENLAVCTNFSLPANEYTVTSNKGQAEIVIFRCP